MRHFDDPAAEDDASLIFYHLKLPLIVSVQARELRSLIG